MISFYKNEIFYQFFPCEFFTDSINRLMDFSSCLIILIVKVTWIIQSKKLIIIIPIYTCQLLRIVIKIHLNLKCWIHGVPRKNLLSSPEYIRTREKQQITTQQLLSRGLLAKHFASGLNLCPPWLWTHSHTFSLTWIVWWILCMDQND